MSGSSTLENMMRLLRSGSYVSATTRVKKKFFRETNRERSWFWGSAEAKKRPKRAALELGKRLVLQNESPIVEAVVGGNQAVQQLDGLHDGLAGGPRFEEVSDVDADQGNLLLEVIHTDKGLHLLGDGGWQQVAVEAVLSGVLVGGLCSPPSDSVGDGVRHVDSRKELAVRYTHRRLKPAASVKEVGAYEATVACAEG